MFGSVFTLRVNCSRLTKNYIEIEFFKDLHTRYNNIIGIKKKLIFNS